SAPKRTGDRWVRCGWVSPSRFQISLPAAPARKVPVSTRASEMLSLREEKRAEGPALPSETIGWNENTRPDAPSNFGAFSTAPPTLRYQSPENQLSAAAGAALIAASAMAAPIHLAIFMSVAHANTGEALLLHQWAFWVKFELNATQKRWRGRAWTKARRP